MGKREVFIKNYPPDIQEDAKILSGRYCTIKQRCYNSKSKDYKNYGGRGIKLCKEWLEDKNLFIKWALENGYKKELHIDRKNNDEDYSPNNCRFITLAENNRNQRRPKASPEFTYEVLYGKYKDMGERAISRLDVYSASTVHRIRHRDCSKEIEEYKRQNNIT